MTLSRTTTPRLVETSKIVNFVESSVDGEQDVPVLGFLGKLYIRRWLFATCVMVPTLLSIVATLLTPMTWVARTEIMVRYGSSESAFLQNLIPENRASLSGPVIGEMVRSLPTLIETVRRYDIKPDDVYQESNKVAFSNFLKLLPFRSHRQDSVDPSDEQISIARMLQNSLEESAQSGSNAFSSKTRPVEILGKDSTVPQAMKGDELITLTLRAFNRAKVAEMTNGLAQTVIDIYYKISAEDAHRSYEFLSSLVDQGEAALRDLSANPDATLPPFASGMFDGGNNDAAVRNSPAVTKLNNELASAQTELSRTQQFFGSDTSRIQRTTAEINDLKRLIERQERADSIKQTLDQIKVRRFQAQNTEDLYRKRLVPISIIEPAVTPERSDSAQIMRLVVSGVTGLMVGTILGLALVIVFGLLDQRLFTPSDVERNVGLPTIGWLPKLKTWRQKSGFLPEIEDHALWNAETGLLQTLSYLDSTRNAGFGSVIAIASPTNDEGKSLAALILAKTLARPGRCKVLLIDADPTRASISNHFRHMMSLKTVDKALPIGRLTDLIIETGVPNLDLLPADLIQENENVGFYLSRVRDLFAEASGSYDLVIVDTPSISESGEALMCCIAATSVLFVVKSGFSRALLVKAFLRKLHEVAVRPQGVILNCRYGVLPPFFDRGV